MRVLMMIIYSIVNRIANNSALAIIVTLLYTTICNLIILKGVYVLVKELTPGGILALLFNFPFILGTGVVVLAVNILISWSVDFTMVKRINVTPLLFYTAIALLALAYIVFLDKVPFPKQHIHI